jgi:hypothetical protein
MSLDKDLQHIPTDKPVHPLKTFISQVTYEPCIHDANNNCLSELIAREVEIFSKESEKL